MSESDSESQASIGVSGACVDNESVQVVVMSLFNNLAALLLSLYCLEGVEQVPTVAEETDGRATALVALLKRGTRLGRTDEGARIPF